MVQKFSEKAKNQLDEKHQKKAKSAREARDPVAEYEAALYKLPNGKFGIPTPGLKNCAVSACRFIEGVAMTTAKGAFHVVDNGSGLTEIIGPKPVVDERIVRVGKFGNKQPMTRYRPRFDKWEIAFDVIYNPRVLSAAQLLNLYQNAGFSIGLCEYRPEKGGNLGMFSVKGL